MALAVIAAEDQRFPLHSGFDVEAIRAALQDAEHGANLRGASTISQQVAKHLFLWPPSFITTLRNQTYLPYESPDISVVK